VLKHSLTLRPEIEMLMNEKGKVVVELGDEKWLWDLALLCDIRNHVNDLNTNFKVNRTSFLICLGLSELK
jgi:hypothetical protein